MNIKDASAAHGLSEIIKSYKENRSRIKLDMNTMGDMGAIIYTNDYMIYDSRCNETVRGANKEIVISAVSCISQIMKIYRELETSFAVVSINAVDNRSWPTIDIVITNMRGDILHFTLSFNQLLIVKTCSWNGNVNMDWYVALSSDFGNN